MGELFIRNLDDAILIQLKRRAWQSGLSLEEYLRRLIISDVRSDEAHADSHAALHSLQPLPPMHDSDANAQRPTVLHS